MSTLVVKSLRRTWRITRAAWHILIGAVVAQIFLVGPNTLLPRAQVQRLQRAAVRWWVRGLCHILRLQVRHHGPLPQRTTLLVTNHISWLDIPALLSVVDADFVAKQDVIRWPVIGTMAARAGTIFLARGGRDAARFTADRMTWRLAQRNNVIVFPEATTTDGRSVRRFHARLYQAAIRTHSRVQAVAIRYPGLDGPHGVAPFIDDDGLLAHLWNLLGEKQIVAELHFCEPVIPNDMDRRTLANRTRHQICAALGFEQDRLLPLSAKFRFPRQSRSAAIR